MSDRLFLLRRGVREGVLSPWPMSEGGGGVGVGLGVGQLLRFPGAMSAALFWVILFGSDG